MPPCQPLTSLSNIKVKSSPFSALKYADCKYVPGKGSRPRSAPVKPYEIDWIVAPVLLLSPLVGLAGSFFVPLVPKTFLFTFFLVFCCGMSITAGYHRLWSHKAYQATWPLQLFLAVFGAFSMEGSIRWWSRNHRAHHKFTDTTKDPYDVIKSFWWAHIGWMLVKQDLDEVGRADIGDLDKNPIVRWQHKYYVPLVLVGMFAPSLVAGHVWGDYLGGYLYAGIWRLVIVHHATFFVNSLAHYLGEQPYSNYHTSCDSIITAVVSFGEGYHNYHHEFPQDYRNGVKWYHYDPTKWLIKVCYYFGMAYDLRYVPDNEILKAKYQKKSQELNLLKGELSTSFPVWNHERVQKEIHADPSSAAKILLIIFGKVYDATQFSIEHPGGIEILRKFNGMDVTSQFKGEQDDYHIHSKFAITNLLPAMQVAEYEP
eukprot:Sdes_comp17201_c0_seq1m6376